MTKDIMGKNIKVGDWVAQIRVGYHVSSISAEPALVTDIQDGQARLVSAYNDNFKTSQRNWYRDKGCYQKAKERHIKTGGVELSKRKVFIGKLIKINPDKDMQKLVKKYEKASGIKLTSN